MNRKGENEKKKGNSSIITLFYPSRVCLYFSIISILLGLIGGAMEQEFGPYHVDEEFWFFLIFPIFAIISGIYTKNPIYGAICILLCGFFFPIAGYRPFSDPLAVTSAYSIIGAFSGLVSYRMAKKKKKLIETSFKIGDFLDDDTIDIYTSVDTPKQLDTVTTISNIEGVGKYAECPYCGSNIRETFYELGGIVKCNKCGAFHHKECFEFYGRKCGSSSCKLREA